MNNPGENSVKVCLYCARYSEEKFNVRPLGISYLASYLIQNEIVSEENLRIVDNCEEAVAFHPHIIGVSSVSQVISDACEFARKCKEATGCMTVLGGYHVSSIPQRLPNQFDLGVIGEGEETFAEIVKKYSNNVGHGATFNDITGICYRSNDLEVLLTPARPLIADIDTLPLPLRHKPYSADEPIFTSRGCPFRCTFCASQRFWRGQTRFRSANSVVHEIVETVEKYQPKEIAILDDLWMSDKLRFKEIVNQLVELGIPNKVTFRGFCRSNIIDEESLLLLKKLNYSFVRFGAETGSDGLLKRIKGEGISVDDHQRVIDLCHKHGMRCGGSFIFGIPGETMIDLRETVRFLRKNKNKFEIIGFYLFNPIPGTVMWEDLKVHRKVSDNLAFDRLQLDLLHPDFLWEDVLYFNDEQIPLDSFRKVVCEIRNEFVNKINEIPQTRNKVVNYTKTIIKNLRSLLDLCIK